MILILIGNSKRRPGERQMGLYSFSLLSLALLLFSIGEELRIGLVQHVLGQRERSQPDGEREEVVDPLGTTSTMTSLDEEENREKKIAGSTPVTPVEANHEAGISGDSSYSTKEVASTTSRWRYLSASAPTRYFLTSVNCKSTEELQSVQECETAAHGLMGLSTTALLKPRAWRPLNTMNRAGCWYEQGSRLLVYKAEGDDRDMSANHGDYLRLCRQRHEDEHHFASIYFPTATILLAIGVSLLCFFVGTSLLRDFLPSSLLLVLSGMLTKVLGHLFPEDTPIAQLINAVSHVDPHVLFWLLLPMLLYEDGASADWRVLRPVFRNAMVLAGPGVLISFLLLAVLIRATFHNPVPKEIARIDGGIQVASSDLSPNSSSVTLDDADADVGWPFESATDPVAVIGALKKLGAPARLSLLIAGEALLNDATAVVFFLLFFDIARGVKEFSLGGSILTFIRLACGGPLLATVGMLFVFTMLKRVKHIDANVFLFTVSAVVFALFFVAEMHEIHVSGVLAVVAFAFWYAAVGKDMMLLNGGDHLAHAHHQVIGFLAQMSNDFIFYIAGVVMGRYMLYSDMGVRDWAELVLLYFMCHLCRATAVLLLLPVLNTTGFGVSIKEAMVCVFGGLRGAVGLAMALLVELDQSADALDVELRLRIGFHVSGMALLTLAINGVAFGRVYNALNLYPGRGEGPNQLMMRKSALLAEGIIFEHLKEMHHHWLFCNMSDEAILKLVPRVSEMLMHEIKEDEEFLRITKIITDKMDSESGATSPASGPAVKKRKGDETNGTTSDSIDEQAAEVNQEVQEMSKVLSGILIPKRLSSQANLHQGFSGKKENAGLRRSLTRFDNSHSYAERLHGFFVVRWVEFLLRLVYKTSVSVDFEKLRGIQKEPTALERALDHLHEEFHSAKHYERVFSKLASGHLRRGSAPQVRGQAVFEPFEWEHRKGLFCFLIPEMPEAFLQRQEHASAWLKDSFDPSNGGSQQTVLNMYLNALTAGLERLRKERHGIATWSAAAIGEALEFSYEARDGILRSDACLRGFAKKKFFPKMPEEIWTQPASLQRQWALEAGFCRLYASYGSVYTPIYAAETKLYERLRTDPNAENETEDVEDYTPSTTKSNSKTARGVESSPYRVGVSPSDVRGGESASSSKTTPSKGTKKKKFADVLHANRVSFAKLEEGARALLFYCLLVENARALLQPLIREAVVLDEAEKVAEAKRHVEFEQNMRQDTVELGSIRQNTKDLVGSEQQGPAPRRANTRSPSSIPIGKSSGEALPMGVSSSTKALQERFITGSVSFALDQLDTSLRRVLYAARTLLIKTFLEPFPRLGKAWLHALLARGITEDMYRQLELCQQAGILTGQELSLLEEQVFHEVFERLELYLQLEGLADFAAEDELEQEEMNADAAPIGPVKLDLHLTSSRHKERHEIRAKCLAGENAGARRKTLLSTMTMPFIVKKNFEEHGREGEGRKGDGGDVGREGGGEGS
ncbi:unnamed protein product [Amoebophrya sp. A25]|nr:unnamed protein product [Amoebophrya sp. A25]|eukprot:GSA25T00025654001.1